MIQMNGPRAIWGRLPSLALSLFIIFKQKDSLKDLSLNTIDREDTYIIYTFVLNILQFYWGYIIKFVRASWMVAEQIVLSRQTQVGQSDEEQFVNWRWHRKAREQGETQDVAIALCESYRNRV